MRNIFRFGSYLKPYKIESFAALLFLTAVVAMDLSIPRLVQIIIDEGIHRHDLQLVFQTGFIMLGISALSVIFAVGNNILSVRVGESVARDIREALFLKIQSFSFGNMDRLKTGQLMVRLSSDTTALQRVIQVSLRIGTRAPLLMAGSFILMVRTSSSLAMHMIPLLLVTSVIIVFFVVKMEPLFRSVQQQLDKLNTVLQENIAGIRLIKAFVRADFESGRFYRANQAFTLDSIHVMRFMVCMPPVLIFCLNAGIVLVVRTGGLEAIRGEMTIGQIVAFTNYLLTTMAPLIFMAMLSNVWAGGIASAKRVTEILDIVPEICENPASKAISGPFEGRIAFEHVSFSYSSGCDAHVLDDISFIAEPGMMVAVLGPTGAGKSTLVNLIPRFYDVSSGRVLIDGIDVRETTQDSLLANIAMVPQETVLFSGSVMDNIRYGVPDASEDKVVEAAKAAQAHDFILALPKGYASRVEERGVNLSGGQKQRIAIARALLASPRVLILDDSTSAVDIETETRIQDVISSRERKSTLVVVAQRVSTVLKADRIIVLENGRVVGQGDHASLMKKCDVYREIYDSQLGASKPDEKPDMSNASREEGV
ncbi:MAG: ABC transporter ATP-binding protein [Chlorobium sp.]|nr:MAG: ABC transporter ATP-binding protein [Chlorobium sp.]